MGETQKKLAEIFILTSSLINRLDDLETTTAGKELKTEASNFMEKLEFTLEKFYNSKISQHNIFIELEKKIDYVFDKNIKIK